MIAKSLKTFPMFAEAFNQLKVFILSYSIFADVECQ